MGKLNGVLGTASVHKSVENFAGSNHRAHRNSAVGDLLGNVHDIRRNAKRFCAGSCATATKSSDHFIEYQQNIVGGTDLAQPIQIAFGRHNHPSRARHRLNDHSRNGGCIVQGDLIKQRISKLSAGFGLATSEGVTCLQRVRQMRHIHQLAIVLTVATDATQAGATNIHPVIALGTANHACLLGLTF